MHCRACLRCFSGANLMQLLFLCVGVLQRATLHMQTPLHVSLCNYCEQAACCLLRALLSLSELSFLVFLPCMPHCVFEGLALCLTLQHVLLLLLFLCSRACMPLAAPQSWSRHTCFSVLPLHQALASLVCHLVCALFVTAGARSSPAFC
jgi:hypothetical protein